jgi:hypothetical protein
MQGIHLRQEAHIGSAHYGHSLLIIPPGHGSRSCRCIGGREGFDGEGVDDEHVGDADALGHGQENVPSSTWAGGGPIGGCAGAVGEPAEVAEGGSSVEAMPARCTARRKIC